MSKPRRVGRRLRQRGNWSRMYRRACAVAQRWANEGGKPVYVWRIGRGYVGMYGYSETDVPHKSLEPKYIAKTVYPQTGGVA